MTPHRAWRRCWLPLVLALAGCDTFAQLGRCSLPEAHPDTDGILDTDVEVDCDADDDGAEGSGDGCAATDCDDADAAVNPSAAEVPYDGVDNDCAGGDECDVDGDGALTSIAACGGDDCDDAVAAINPNETEVPYDGVDQDCSGADLCDVDVDGEDDPVCGGLDCDDADAAVNPSAIEVPYDGVDNDCAGGDECDVDGDGALTSIAACGGNDCDDADGAVNPSATEVPYDGIDQDCSGADLCDVDADGEDDPACGGLDCDDTDGSVNTGAVERCADGVDNDCDGRLDETDGLVYWNDLSAFPVPLSANTTASVPVDALTVAFVRDGGDASPYTPPNTLDGSFTSAQGDLVRWTGEMPYIDILAPVSGTLTFDFGGTAPDLVGSGWSWLVGVAGTAGGSGDEGPVVFTVSESLADFGQFDAFSTGNFPVLQDPTTVVGSANTTADGYAFFTLPASATQLVITIDDQGITPDQHGWIVGTVSPLACQ